MCALRRRERGVYAASLHSPNGALRSLRRRQPERTLKRRKRRVPVFQLHGLAWRGALMTVPLQAHRL